MSGKCPNLRKNLQCNCHKIRKKLFVEELPISNSGKCLKPLQEISKNGDLSKAPISGLDIDFDQETYMNDHVVGKLSLDHSLWEYIEPEETNYQGFESPVLPFGNMLPIEPRIIQTLVEETLVPYEIVPVEPILTPISKMLHTLCPYYDQFAAAIVDPLIIDPNDVPVVDNLPEVIGPMIPPVLENMPLANSDIAGDSQEFDCVEVCKAVDSSVIHHGRAIPSRVLKYMNDPYCASCILVGGQDICDFLNGRKSQNWLLDQVVSSSTASSDIG
ncbi:hypothetical protein M0R45_030992 [Rubus argutus]|uniref:Uncharacterized protein n=1 Tax=Rubus argutus TaxID=59490 RepID=A0AAW1WGZ9_RUBAR